MELTKMDYLDYIQKAIECGYDKYETVENLTKRFPEDIEDILIGSKIYFYRAFFSNACEFFKKELSRYENDEITYLDYLKTREYFIKTTQEIVHIFNDLGLYNISEDIIDAYLKCGRA